MDNKEKKFWNWFVENKQFFEGIISNMQGLPITQFSRKVLEVKSKISV